jgi:hypothetical protein
MTFLWLGAIGVLLMGGRKPGFFPKHFVTAHRFGEKPGFFSSYYLVLSALADY